jgi:hypothetical protein
MSPEPTAPLRADVVYIAPSGRRCRWLPASGEHRQITSHAHFIYLDRPQGRQRHREAANWQEGFYLTPPNYQLLRIEGGSL